MAASIGSSSRPAGLLPLLPLRPAARGHRPRSTRAQDRDHRAAAWLLRLGDRRAREHTADLRRHPPRCREGLGLRRRPRGRQRAPWPRAGRDGPGQRPAPRQGQGRDRPAPPPARARTKDGRRRSRPASPRRGYGPCARHLRPSSGCGRARGPGADLRHRSPTPSLRKGRELAGCLRRSPPAQRRRGERPNQWRRDTPLRRIAFEPPILPDVATPTTLSRSTSSTVWCAACSAAS